MFSRVGLRPTDGFRGDRIRFRAVGRRPTLRAWRWSSARAYESLDTIGPPIAFDLVPRGTGPLT